MNKEYEVKTISVVNDNFHFCRWENRPNIVFLFWGDYHNM